MDTNFEVILEQFKTLRAELDLRNKQHTQLVAFKVVALGALVSYFAEKALVPAPSAAPAQTPAGSPLLQIGVQAAYFIWLIPLIAVVLDILIAGNLRAMYNIGPYIKEFIEPVFRSSAPPGMQFWEETVASADPSYRCYRPFDMVAVWVFTLLPFLVIAAMRVAAGYTIIDWAGSVLVAMGACLSLRLLIRAITMPRIYPRQHPA